MQLKYYVHKIINLMHQIVCENSLTIMHAYMQYDKEKQIWEYLEE